MNMNMNVFDRGYNLVNEESVDRWIMMFEEKKKEAHDDEIIADSLISLLKNLKQQDSILHFPTIADCPSMR